MGLKALAFLLTGSTGLLSDAAESLVNIAGAVMAFAMLTIAARPPDQDHLYGHTKAEYFASAVEGGLILATALGVGGAAIMRIIWPRPIERTGIGLSVTALAMLINLITARILIAAGKRYDSIALEADGRHLMTDIWTSVAVILGVGAVALTGLVRLDGLVALAMAIHILWTGWRSIQESIAGLMDSALPANKQQALQSVLEHYRQMGMHFHRIRTRRSAASSFIDLHVLVPGSWSVHDGHHILEQIESDIKQVIADATVHTHIEPIEDPISFHGDPEGGDPSSRPTGS
jgi:cation diffusion facilitator family transporter